MIKVFIGLALGVLATAAARAQDAPALCADRPGKATPSCVAARGTIQIETSALDWTRDDSAGTRSDTFLFADSLVKLGIGGDTEARVAVTPHIRQRTRDASGVTIADGFGDIGLSLRHRLIDGGDRRVSFAVQPFVTLPVGDKAVSAGTWSAGIVTPLDIPTGTPLALNLTPTWAAVADEDGDGRHFQASIVAAATHPISGTLSGTFELFAQTDDDPAGSSTQATADFLLAWAPADDWQFDLSSYVGLTRATPDLSLLIGFTRAFR